MTNDVQTFDEESDAIKEKSTRDPTHITQHLIMNDSWKTVEHFRERLEYATWLAGEFVQDDEDRKVIGNFLLTESEHQKFDFSRMHSLIRPLHVVALKIFTR